MKSVYLPPSLVENNTLELYIRVLYASGYSSTLAPQNSIEVLFPWEHCELIIPPVIVKNTTFWKRLKEICPDCDNEKVHKAFDLSQSIHKDQIRDNNRAYFAEHILPVSLYYLISTHKLNQRIDEDLLITCLLHDSIEDASDKVVLYKGTDKNGETVIENEFGLRVAQMIDILTKPKIEDKQLRLKLYVKRLNDSPDAIYIKCIDRILNLASDAEQISTKDPMKIRRYLAETKEHFAPFYDRIDPYFKGILEIIIKVIESESVYINPPIA